MARLALLALLAVSVVCVCLWDVRKTFAFAAPVPFASAPASANESSSSAAADPVAQCTICRDLVQCGHAYHGRQGKFCQSLTRNRVACCCPRSASCVGSDSKCQCDEMLFGEYTPLLMLACGVTHLVITIYKCIRPTASADDTTSIGNSATRRVTERSRVFPNTTNYGSMATRAGDQNLQTASSTIRSV